MKIIKADLRHKSGGLLSAHGKEPVDHLLKLFANTDDDGMLCLISEKGSIEIDRSQGKLSAYYRVS